jgi:hypothetical protein
MTTPAKLRAIKTAALKWVAAKNALEAYVNGCALSAKKINQQNLAELTLAYTAAERELEAIAVEEPALQASRRMGERKPMTTRQIYDFGPVKVVQPAEPISKSQWASIRAALSLTLNLTSAGAAVLDLAGVMTWPPQKAAGPRRPGPSRRRRSRSPITAN